MKDFTDYRFRCSSLGKLMVEGRGACLTENQLKTIKELEDKQSTTTKGLTEKQFAYLNELRTRRDAPPELSETTKSYLRELFIEENFGRKKDIFNKYIEKGLYVEEDSLTLIQKHYEGSLIIKNKAKYDNEFIQGTPDILMQDRIVDAKSSWDIFTFYEADGTDKDYFYQMQGYMQLTHLPQADLIYCLANAPEHMIVAEKSKKTYQLGLSDGSEESAKMEFDVEKNMMFDDIEDAKRIKVFNIKFDPKAIESLSKKIVQAREYLNSLTF